MQKLLAFFSKNTCELDIVLTRIVNILATHELIKLTMPCTTGPWLLNKALNALLLQSLLEPEIYADLGCTGFNITGNSDFFGTIKGFNHSKRRYNIGMLCSRLLAYYPLDIIRKHVSMLKLLL